MTDHEVAHATFTLERTYPVAPARVFTAWSDPATKRRWFAPPEGHHELDFRVGGQERTVAVHEGHEMAFETSYRDIVADERIVYSSTLARDTQVCTVSLTTVELEAVDRGTRLVLTEQAAYLDGLELPAWRESGTSDWLDALGTDLAADLATDLATGADAPT